MIQILINNNKKININWISNYQEMKNNKQTDQIIKKIVVRSIITSNKKMSLVHVRKAQTEVRKAHRQDWLNNALRNKASEHRHRYRAQNDWRQDSAIAAAFRRLVCHYVQLKSDHAAIEAHLTHIKAWNSSACTHCETMNESVCHVLLKCREWQTQQSALYKVLVKAEVSWISAAEKLSESRLLRDFRVIKALLQFLTDITVRCFENENTRTVIRAQLNNECDLKKLKTEKHSEKK